MKNIYKSVLPLATSILIFFGGMVPSNASQNINIPPVDNKNNSLSKKISLNKIIGVILPSSIGIVGISLFANYLKSISNESSTVAKPTTPPLGAESSTVAKPTTFNLEPYRVKDVGERKLKDGTLYKPKLHIVLDNDHFRDFLATTTQMVYFRGINNQCNPLQYTDDFKQFGLGISTTSEAIGNRADQATSKKGEPVYFAHYVNTPLEFASRFRKPNTYSMIYVGVILNDGNNVQDYGLGYMENNENFVLCSDAFIINPDEWKDIDNSVAGQCTADFNKFIGKFLTNDANRTDDKVMCRFKKWIFSKGLVFEKYSNDIIYCVYNRRLADKLLAKMRRGQDFDL